MGDFALCVAPDFRAGALIVRQGIVGVGELVEDDPPAFVAHPVGGVDRRFHAAGLRCQHDFRAKGVHDLAPLHAHMFRHHQHHFVAAHRRRHRQGDAGIAAGCLDQGVARFDLAARFRPPDHEQRRPILDRASRVVAFQFDQHDVAGIAWQSFQLNQRRIADKFLDALKHCRFLLYSSQQLGIAGRIR